MATVGVVLDPELGLDPQDVVSAWNRDPDAGSLGVASVPDDEEALDFSPTIEVVQVVVDLGVGVTSALVYDTLKDLVHRLRKRISDRDVSVAEVGSSQDGDPVVGISESSSPPLA